MVTSMHARRRNADPFTDGRHIYSEDEIKMRGGGGEGGGGGGGGGGKTDTFFSFSGESSIPAMNTMKTAPKSPIVST